MCSDKILALDASSTRVGWCLAQGDSYLDIGTYKPDGDVDERLRKIVCWMAHMIKTHDPDVVGIEEPLALQPTDRILARVCGAIEATAIIYGVKRHLVHPSTVKATGYSKKNRREAALRVGKKEITDDEADAVGVWHAVMRIRFDELHALLNRG